ncbi:Aste57867_20555 [Aphanomyces stellatus]|uniref:Aste57867_20555 protein n=1 Tax=Aphanomyces stellatus TaxID=120398 RepID=A0A485LFY4_9STRA|nr:hypothetical protein As57867_020488 [Aphanomyces stellatus]VFT97239.1 Aste57867_20555 [Aphanomyces stellatus]
MTDATRALSDPSMSVLAFIHIQIHGTPRQIPAPVATFGSHRPATHAAPLVHVQPPTAFPAIQNAAALRGKIAVVQRGDCSFAAKAKSIQASGAMAMILTNSSEELVRMGEAFAHEGAGVDIPVLMVGQALGRSLQDGMHAAIHVKHESKSFLQVGVEAMKKTVEQTTGAVQAGVDVVKKSVEGMTNTSDASSGISAAAMENIVKPKPNAPSLEPIMTAPLFAFVLYATNADEFHVQFAPLADFGLSRKKLYFRSRLVFASPLQACPSLANKSAFAGAIGFVERGGCTFPEKIERLQAAGAIAVVVANNDSLNPDAAFVMSVDQCPVDHLSIPSVMLPYAVGQRLQAHPPDSLGIVCLEGAAAGVLLAHDTSTYSLWKPPPSSLQAPLLHAARTGDVASLAALLETTSPHATDAYNVSALHHACIAGSVEAVELLLAAGAHVDALDLGSQTPLHYACMAPSAACVQVLVTAAAHTLAVNEGGSSPLHVACFAGSTECMELLLTATATLLETTHEHKYVFHGVNDVDKSGRTPLHLACRYGHGDCAMYLMAASAQVNFVDYDGCTPMHYAIDRLNMMADGNPSHAELHVVDQLLRYGARMVDAKGALILDRIRSNAMRRDVEVLYLRHEVARQRDQLATWDQEWQRMQVTMQQAVTNAKSEAAAETAQVAQALATQERAIQHLQCQLTSVLQILQAGTTTSSSSVAAAIVLPPAFDTHATEMERAQEAGLARDLGKKCMRAKQYALAKMHLETSLQWYALPGVRRLLDHVDQLVAMQQQQVSSFAMPSTAVLMHTYRARLAKAGASPDVVAAVDAEIATLADTVPGSTQHGMVKAWLEWLVTLPWHEQLPCSLDLFRRVNQVEADSVDAKWHAAAQVIQRAVRDHISARLFQRQWAAGIVQASVRGWRARRQLRCLLVEKRRRDDAERQEADKEATADAKQDKPVLAGIVDVDFETTVDPALAASASSSSPQLSLQAWDSVALHCGVHLEQAKTSKFYILQWVAVSTDHFIWTRWGGHAHDAACALKGPYESADDAQVEFEKLFKLKTMHAYGVAVVDPPSAWAYQPTPSSRRRIQVA